jgi:hypothetical protein
MWKWSTINSQKKWNNCKRTHNRLRQHYLLDQHLAYNGEFFRATLFLYRKNELRFDEITNSNLTRLVNDIFVVVERATGLLVCVEWYRFAAWNRASIFAWKISIQLSRLHTLEHLQNDITVRIWSDHSESTYGIIGRCQFVGRVIGF